MIKKILNAIKNLFVPTKQTEIVHLDKPVVVVDPCPLHRYFRAKCHMCIAAAKGINL